MSLACNISQEITIIFWTYIIAQQKVHFSQRHNRFVNNLELYLNFNIMQYIILFSDWREKEILQTQKIRCGLGSSDTKPHQDYSFIYVSTNTFPYGLSCDFVHTNVKLISLSPLFYYMFMFICFKHKKIKLIISL